MIWTPPEKMVLTGHFTGLHFNKKGRLIRRIPFKNGPTLAGLSHVLSSAFCGGSQITTWYAGLIDNDGFVSVSSSDTMASHANWTELTDYDEATREEWDCTETGQVASNATPMAFTFNATVTARGAFITSNSTKGGSTGTLYATGLFDAQEFDDDEVLALVYQVAASGS